MTKSLGFVKWSLFIILSIIWGSSFILMKRGLEVFTPAQVAAIRMSVSFLCLFPFVIGHIKKIPKEKWKYIVMAGILGNGIPAVLFTTAEMKISSSIAGVLNSLTPLFTVLVGLLFFRYRTTTGKIIGVLLGFVGAALMVLYNSKGNFDTNYYYAFFIILACISYAIDTFILNNYLMDLNPIHVAGFALFFVGIVSGCYLFSTDFTQRVASSPGALKSLGCAALLGAMGTALAQSLFNRMLKISSLLFSASVTYTIPFVAILWGLFDGESLGFIQIIGFVTVLAGIFLINRKKEVKVEIEH
jgi:drug/metabolite transporter (DMT)-like permease